jgi:hypothetical protein
VEKVEFVLGFSRLLACFLGAIYFSAFMILISLPLPILLKLVGVLLLIWHFWYLIKLHIKRIAKKSVVYIWQDSLGRWGCQTQGGKAARGELREDSFKSTLVLILRFRFKSGTRNIIVPVDALTRREYRLLCTRVAM